MAATALADTDKDGAFKRKDAAFRSWVRADGSTDFKPEAGRYVLYVSYACPWAHRCLSFRVIKGLEEAIDVAVVAPIWVTTKPEKDDHRGWAFDPTYPGATSDPVFNSKTVRELYEHAAGEGAVTRFTVPVLFDKATKRIVSNESSEIIRMFNVEFNAIAKRPEIDLYPEPARAEIDAINTDVYDNINNGVYKCGFATKQAAYEAAFESLFSTLEKYDALLETRRFLLGSFLTEADIRLVMTLIRFDEVYIVHFKCHKKPIRYHKNLFAYTCDVVQSAGIGSTINMDHIKKHYYGSHTLLNPYGIIPPGSSEYSDFSVAHGRAERFAGASADGSCVEGGAGGAQGASVALPSVWCTPGAL